MRDLGATREMAARSAGEEHFPPEVAAGVLKAVGVGLGNCQIASLSPNNRVYRLCAPDGIAWILKETVSTAKEAAAMAVSAMYGIRAPEFSVLSDTWILMEDLALDSVQQYIEGKSGHVGPGFYARLGEATMQADLLGMRDRNLRNMLIGGWSEPIILIDFDSTFAIRLLDRFFRHRKYLKYFVMRMFCDVVSKIGEYASVRTADAFGEFCSGAAEELQRLNMRNRETTAGLSRLPFRCRYTVRTRYTDARRLLGDLQHCYNRLAQKGYVNAAS